MSVVVVECGGCHKQFGVAEQHAGKLIRCPDCRVAVRVPEVGSVPEVTAGSAITNASKVIGDSLSTPAMSAGEQPTRAARKSREQPADRPAPRRSEPLRSSERDERAGRPDSSGRSRSRPSRPRAAREASSGRTGPLVIAGGIAAALTLLGLTVLLAVKYFSGPSGTGDSVADGSDRQDSRATMTAADESASGNTAAANTPAANAAPANTTLANATPGQTRSGEQPPSREQAGTPDIARNDSNPGLADATNSSQGLSPFGALFGQQTPATTPAPSGTLADATAGASLPERSALPGTNGSQGASLAGIPTAVPSRNPAATGTRVAWLTDDGNGYARRGAGWKYRGLRSDVPYRTGTGPVTIEFDLIETLRTDAFVELYDAASKTRVRLQDDSAKSYSTLSAAHDTMSGGRWHDKDDAAGWPESAAVASESYAPVRLPETAKLEDLIAAVESNVVRVDVAGSDGEANGSGFLLDASGRIVTNYHVVEGSTNVSVMFKGKSASDSIRAPVVSFLHLDPKRDIAILQAALPTSLQRPGLGLAEKLPAKGSSVVAFGAPLGLDFTASQGIVSGFRTADELEKTLGLTDHAGQWIQTTAPISPGNSGGPLVDRQGQVVAINTMTLTIGQSLNFAISCDDLREAVNVSAPQFQPITPSSVPAMIAKRDHGGSGGDGPGDREVIRVEVLPDGHQIFAVEGTRFAPPLLKKLDEVQLVVIGAERVGTGRVLESVVTDYVKKALLPNGVQIVRDEGPLLLIVAIVDGEDLELVGHLMMQDIRSRVPRLMRVWRGAGNMGTLTETMSSRKRFLGDVHRNVQTFFDDLSNTIKEAKAEPEEQTESDEKPDAE